MTEQPRESDRIQCLECKQWFRALPNHLRRTHGYSDEDYRLKFLIPVGVPLVCIEWSENQKQKNRENNSKKTLERGRQRKGFKQRESVRKHRKGHYKILAKTGLDTASKKDKTERRRELLKPYPITVDEASERLSCTKKAAYNFLSYCVGKGLLKRIKRGVYSLVE